MAALYHEIAFSLNNKFDHFSWIDQTLPEADPPWAQSVVDDSDPDIQSVNKTRSCVDQLILFIHAYHHSNVFSAWLEQRHHKRVKVNLRIVYWKQSTNLLSNGTLSSCAKSSFTGVLQWQWLRNYKISRHWKVISSPNSNWKLHFKVQNSFPKKIDFR